MFGRFAPMDKFDALSVLVDEDCVRRGLISCFSTRSGWRCLCCLIRLERSILTT